MTDGSGGALVAIERRSVSGVWASDADEGGF